MPLIALTWNRILCVHGGIARNLESIGQLKELLKTAKLDDTGIRDGILWNDPSEYVSGFQPNLLRGVYYRFGKDVFDTFMKRNDLTLLIRSHEYEPDGYRYHFDKKLLTIFSYPGYRGSSKGAIAEISEKGEVSIIEINP